MNRSRLRTLVFVAFAALGPVWLAEAHLLPHEHGSGRAADDCSICQAAFVQSSALSASPPRLCSNILPSPQPLPSGADERRPVDPVCAGPFRRGPPST